MHVCAQSCPTLCNPMDCSPPRSSVHGFSRQEYWSELPFPPPGDPPDSRIELESPASLALAVDSIPLSHLGSPQRSLTSSLIRISCEFSEVNTLGHSLLLRL